VALDRAASGPAEPRAKRGVPEQPSDGLDHRVHPLGVHQEAGLAVTHGGRNAATPPRNDRHAARGGLRERDPEPLHPLLHQSRDAQVDLRDVVERGEIAVGHIGEETHPVRDAQLACLGLERLLLLASADHRVPEVRMQRGKPRQRLQRRVDSLVPGEPRYREEPAPVREAVARADLAGIEARTEELVIGAERHDAHPLGRRVDVELTQQGEAPVAGPLAVGDEHRG
jgi:hypothetical protein